MAKTESQALAEVMAELANKGVPPEQLDNALIAVTGWATTFGGLSEEILDGESLLPMYEAALSALNLPVVPANLATSLDPFIPDLKKRDLTPQEEDILRADILQAAVDSRTLDSTTDLNNPDLSEALTQALDTMITEYINGSNFAKGGPVVAGEFYETLVRSSSVIDKEGLPVIAMRLDELFTKHLAKQQKAASDAAKVAKEDFLQGVADLAAKQNLSPGQVEDALVQAKTLYEQKQLTGNVPIDSEISGIIRKVDLAGTAADQKGKELRAVTADANITNAIQVALNEILGPTGGLSAEELNQRAILANNIATEIQQRVDAGEDIDTASSAGYSRAVDIARAQAEDFTTSAATAASRVAYQTQVQSAIDASGLPVEAQNEAFNEAMRLYDNATTRGQTPDTAGGAALIDESVKAAQFKVDGDAALEGVTPDAPPQFSVGAGPDAPGGGPPGIPGVEPIPTPATGTIIPPGSQAASLLQQTATGFTPDQAAAQKATEKGSLSQADSSAVNKFTGGLENPEFASFLSGQTEELFSQFQAAEAKKKTDFAPIAALQAKQGFQPGAGDFAPGTFSDFLKSSLPEVQESFVTKKKGQRKAKAAGTRVSFT